MELEGERDGDAGYLTTQTALHLSIISDSEPALLGGSFDIILIAIYEISNSFEPPLPRSIKMPTTRSKTPASNESQDHVVATTLVEDSQSSLNTFQQDVIPSRPGTPDELLQLQAQRDMVVKARREATMARLRKEIEDNQRAMESEEAGASKSTSMAALRTEGPSDDIARDPPESWYAEIPLSRAAARYLWWGLAVKTRGLYDTGRRSYVLHCRMTLHVRPFPASVQTLSSWIASLGENRLQPKTIESYLAEVRSSQMDTGFEDLEVFHHPVLNRIMTGIKRKNGEADKRERLHKLHYTPHIA